MQRNSVEKNLSFTIGYALKNGISVIKNMEDISNVVIAYSWDGDNNISVLINPEKTDDNMFTIEAKKWL
jgi:hypothetical protein